MFKRKPTSKRVAKKKLVAVHIPTAVPRIIMWIMTIAFINVIWFYSWMDLITQFAIFPYNYLIVGGIEAAAFTLGYFGNKYWFEAWTATTDVIRGKNLIKFFVVLVVAISLYLLGTYELILFTDISRVIVYYYIATLSQVGILLIGEGAAEDIIDLQTPEKLVA